MPQFLGKPSSNPAPTVGDDLVNKTYVDGQITSHTHAYLPLAGGTITGNVISTGHVIIENPSPIVFVRTGFKAWVTHIDTSSQFRIAPEATVAAWDWQWDDGLILDPTDKRLHFPAFFQSGKAVLDTDHTAAADPHPQYALDTDLASKAPLASPTFTGTLTHVGATEGFEPMLDVKSGAYSRFQVDPYGATVLKQLQVLVPDDGSQNPNDTTTIFPGRIQLLRDDTGTPLPALEVWDNGYPTIAVFGSDTGATTEIDGSGVRVGGSRLPTIAELKTLVAASADFAAFKTAIAALPEYP